jgi:hypothetical protein
MIIEPTIDYVKNKVRERGYDEGSCYIEFRHFSLYAGEIRMIDAYSEFYYLMYADKDLSIRSEFGSYDLNDNKINEQQYEHQGRITITNKTKIVKHIIFYQAIPKHK